MIPHMHTFASHALIYQQARVKKGTKAPLPPTHPPSRSLRPAKGRVEIHHPGSGSPSRPAGVRQITSSSHTLQTCARAFSLQLMKIRPHPTAV